MFDFVGGVRVVSPPVVAMLLWEIGVPEVEEQNDAVFCALVLDLVLEGVIEDDGFALAPCAPLTTAADTDVLFGYYHTEVARETGVGGAAVGS